MVNPDIFLRNILIEAWITIRNCLIVVKYETARFLLSNRTLLLLVFCFVPTLLYVSAAGETAAIEIYLHLNGYQWFVGYVLQIYVMFAYIINILVAIVIIQELFINESAIEILLATTKRIELFLGKICTAVIVLLITSIFTWIACVIAFITWQQELPITPSQFLVTLWILTIVSFVPLTVTILGNTLVMKFRSFSGMGNGFAIFIFFVIPFFIFSSVYLGFVTDEILEFSTYFRVFYITNFYLMTEDERFATINDVNDAFTFFGSIAIISLVLSWIFFWQMETRKKD